MARSGLGLAVALYLAWCTATWLLEGRPGTLNRPEAQQLRLLYTLVANLGVGTLGALAWLARHRSASLSRSSFSSRRRTLVAGSIALVLGLAAAWRLETRDPWILVNAFAQVLPVSLAELLVCWTVLGAAVESRFARFGQWSSVLLAGTTSTLAFGLYHLAHSPPFDQLATILGLTLVGAVVTVFYRLSRSLEATLLFHALLALTGVVGALESSGNTVVLAQPRPLLWLPALLALAALLPLHRLAARHPDDRRPAV